MKRTGNLYSQITSMDNLYLAHRNASKGKGWYAEVKMVNGNPEHYLRQLQHSLLTHTYHTSPYTTFIKHDSGKERIIYKLPYYPDRICQWAVMQVISPYLMKRLIPSTYSALPKRGIHKALYDIRRDIRHDTENCTYCLKLDIHHYYPSINHEILKSQFGRIFKDAELLYILDEIIDSVSTGGTSGTGIPIGNYLSQWAGNYYLSAFDHWIKQRVKHYYRYMDDIVILHGDKRTLHTLYGEIESYLHDTLRLTVKSNWQVFPTFIRGLDFVGYRIFNGYTLLRKSTAVKFKRKMLRLAAKPSLSYSDKCSIESYKGWLKHCDGHRLTVKYLGKAA